MARRYRKSANYTKNFALLPDIKYRRSVFDLPFRHRTTFNMGQLVPIYDCEVSPGDTFNVKANAVLRLNSPLIKPIMDNLFLDMFFFFVPNRLAYKDWPKTMGENDNDWVDDVEHPVPVFSASSSNNYFYNFESSVLSYFGVPANVRINTPISVLPVNSYAKVWNDWFRDENLQDSVNLLSQNTTIIESSPGVASAAWGPNVLYLAHRLTLAPVNKLHDYFTSGLPAPQKGSPVNVPIGLTAPVVGDGGALGLQFTDDTTTKSGYLFATASNSGTNNAGLMPESYRFSAMGEPVDNVLGNSGNPYMLGVSTVGANSGLYADLSQAAGVNVNDLRYLLALQRMLEKDAVGGTRYIEFLRTHFGVISPDGRLQRSEYLGGARIPVNVSQVVQQSQSNETSDLGDLGAFSLTNGTARFSKGFTEHGRVIGLVCVRQFHSYQQGIPRRLTRYKRTDFYDPVFNNIGEQPVYTYELYAGSSSSATDPTRVFNYNEAWATYRSGESRISGALSSLAQDSLDVWHLGDNYSNQPYYTSAFIQETPVYLDRALAVPSSSNDQFLIDFYAVNRAFRVMTPYSTPSIQSVMR